MNETKPTCWDSQTWQVIHKQVLKVQYQNRRFNCKGQNRKKYVWKPYKAKLRWFLVWGTLTTIIQGIKV